MDIAAPATDNIPPGWRERYAQKHYPRRIRKFPNGVAIPQHVRLYERNGHYLLHFWDPAVKRTLYARVEGDLIDAISKARELDDQINQLRRTGLGVSSMTHRQLVDRYLEDLDRRANAGAIACSTADRYRSALRHYLAYATRPEISVAFPYVSHVNRTFALGFSAFLGSLRVPRNGHPNSVAATLKQVDYVMDTVRSMFAWAADPERGNCLPSGFHNPFQLRVIGRRRRVAPDLVGEPDITISMASDFLSACDNWQLRLFCPVVFYGLRPSELIFLFHEMLDERFLDVLCIEDLAHMTKGRRNKRLPLLQPIHQLLRGSIAHPERGLVFCRRHMEFKSAPLAGKSLQELAAEFRSRCHRFGTQRASDVVATRDSLLKDAGALSYDVIQGEFARITKQLGWPPEATLKDLRHLCNTSLANGGMPEHERRYLLGHHPGRDAIVTYTHLNQLAEHYRAAVEREMSPLLQILNRRAQYTI